MISSLRTALAVIAILTLAACESPQEKAERFYRSGLALLEAGDVDRALIEFRNVFEYDGFHKEARQTYADVQLSRGAVAEAYAQYLRLIEQYPDEIPARLTLAELAVTRGDWAEVRRHGDAATALAPDDPQENDRAQAIAAAIAYHSALADLDTGRARDAVIKARAILDSAPDNITARRIVIDAATRSDDPSEALPDIDAALATDPASLEFHVAKLRILAAAAADINTDDSAAQAAAVAQLQVMFDLFPDNAEVRASLVNWYLSQGDYDAAEDLLRRLAGDATGPTGGHVTLVQFLQGARGADAARAELDRLRAANDGTPHADLYHAMQAALGFEAGDHANAIATLRAIADAAEPTDQTLQIRIMLARMLETTGDTAAARAEVDTILQADTAHVPALKMRAAWQIANDDPDGAITALRTALNQAPRDAEIMMLMARAHARAGSTELAGERLALAVDVSGAAAEPALAYVQFLLQSNRPQAAESVLLDARRANPADLEIISRLADLWLGQQNWARAADLVTALAAIPDSQAAGIATAIQAEILMGRNQVNESLAILQNELADLDDQARATLTIVLAQIRSGKTDEARVFLSAALARTPDDQTLQLLSGSLHMIMGEVPQAEATFRAILDAAPQTEAAARLLYSLLSIENRPDEALAVLEAGLTASPDAATLLWIKAGVLEQAGDIDGAIAIYETLYSADSSNVIVANNLASLIATHRDDAASLDRAENIARRLRGMDVPAFQDTYGWIAARRGDHAEALTYLRPAAQGLPEDALVQFHLGMTYAALGLTDDARTTLTRAVALGADSPLPQFTTARAKLAELETQ